MVWDLTRVAIFSIASIVALFFLTKMIGNRQVSQLSLFDYINGITIGSIAAEMATSLEKDALQPLLAMTIYALATWLVSILNNTFFHGTAHCAVRGRKALWRKHKEGAAGLE